MSGCTITVWNSVRISAPVGHASRQPAFVQCLQTSDMNTQRSRPSTLPSAVATRLRPPAAAPGSGPRVGVAPGRPPAAGGRDVRQMPALAARERRGRLLLPRRRRRDGLDEAHVAPGRCRQRARVVVRAALLELRAVGGQVVPLLARHLAGLAADAHGGVGEEAHPLGVRRTDRDLAQRAHSSSSSGGWWVSPVCPAFSGSSAPWSPDSLSSSSATCASRAVDAPWRRPGRTSHQNVLSSIETFGAPDSATRSLTVSPVTPCALVVKLPQCHGSEIWGGGRPPIPGGRMPWGT